MSTPRSGPPINPFPKPKPVPADSLVPSQRCIAVACHFESFQSVPYRDPVGLWTLGWGHRMLPGDARTSITRAEGYEQLNADMASAAAAVARLVTVPLTQGQFDCLCDFTFNEGQGRLASSTLLSAINAGRYAVVPSQLYSVDESGEQHGWIFAGGEILPGLVLRRQADIALWNDAELSPEIIVAAVV